MVLRSFGYDDVSVGYYIVGNRSPLDVGREGVTSCDLYIAILGESYGYVPRENNPDGRSISELEYELAVELSKPRLIFAVDIRQWTSTLSRDPDLRNVAFHTRVRRTDVVRSVTSPTTLQNALREALGNLHRGRLHTTPAAPSPQTTPQTIALIRSLTDSPERIARLLASIVLADRSRLALLESPNTAGVADALSSHNAQSAEGVATIIGRMDDERFEPDPLWLAWITHIHRERLTEVGTEILRVSGLGGLE
jgi:Domain of unknown function (DUF4062)